MINDWLVSSGNSKAYDFSIAAAIDKVNFFYKNLYFNLTPQQRFLFLRGIKTSLKELEDNNLPTLLKSIPIKELIRYNYCNK